MVALTMPSRRSLRQRTMQVGLLTVVFLVAILSLVFMVGVRVRGQMSAAITSTIVEQKMADEIVRGVLRQLAIVSVPTANQDSAMQREFDEVGGAVESELRQYLFRSLTIEERTQIERVKEAHRSMEITAARVLVLPPGGPDRSAETRVETVNFAFTLIDALEEFARLRESGLADTMREQERLVQQLLLLGGVLLLVLVGGGLWVLKRFVDRHMVTPLHVLTAAASRIGRGDLSARVPTQYDREFQSLAAAFNRMSTRLDEARSELEGERTALAEALDQVQSAQSELIQAEKLGALGRMTAGLAHELNNPLATVLGYSELLAASLEREATADKDELKASYVDPIVREARRARLLVRSLLQFTRRTESVVGPVRLRDALRVVEELRRFAFEQAGVELDLQDVPDFVIVGERQRMQGVFLNIMNNALDVLSPRGTGMLVVRAERDGEWVRVAFEDNGPGLSDLDRVFEPFFTTKEVGKGTGLGLALAERFMDSFGGRITAENRAEGGARFMLSFLASDESPPKVATLDTPPSASSLPLRVATRRQAVLVVEDEVHLQRLHRSLLARLDVDVEIAGTVAEARPMVEGRSYDVIISDVKMPGESGLEFYRWMLSRDAGIMDHFLFVTGDVADPELAEIADERPQAFLLKPFDAREYLARVASLLD